MKIFQVVSVVLGTLIAVSACSGGGNGRVIGVQCPKNYNPVPMDVEASKKVALEQDLPPGNYKYVGSEFYFVDAQSDLRVSAQDVELITGEWKPRIGCVRNNKLGTASFEVNTLGLSAMKVEANKKITTFEAKTLGFKITDGKIEAVGAPLTEEEKPSSPKEVYDEGAAGERFLYQVNDTRWEVRATGVINGSKYQMVSRFDREDLKPPKPVEKKPEEQKPEEQKPEEETPVEGSTAG